MIMLDLLRILLFDEHSLFVLNNFDQCSRERRAIFLDYLGRLSKRSERKFNVVITSQSHQALQGEVRGAMVLDADAFVSAADDDERPITSPCLTRLCLGSAYKSRLDAALSKLKPMGKWTATKLRFAQHHTGWPANPSLESLDEFTCIVELMSPDEAPEVALDKMLRSTSPYKEFRWLLGWVICGYRPLSLDELTDLLFCLCGKRDRLKSTLSKRCLMAGYRRQVESWFRVLAKFKHDKVTLRHEIRDIFHCGWVMDSFTWSEAIRMAHRSIVNFCLAYLVSDKAQRSMQSLSSRFLSVLPDGENIMFYIIQALPYHLAAPCQGFEKPNRKLGKQPLRPLGQGLLGHEQPPYAHTCTARIHSSNPRGRGHAAVRGREEEFRKGAAAVLNRSRRQPEQRNFCGPVSPRRF